MGNPAKEFLKLKRVFYGKKSTPMEDREYRLLGTDGPAGTLDEWRTDALSRGIKNIVAFDENMVIDTVYDPKGCK